MEIPLEKLEIGNLTVNTDEAANAIEFQIDGRITNIDSDILEKVSGSRIVPKTVICELKNADG